MGLIQILPQGVSDKLISLLHCIINYICNKLLMQSLLDNSKFMCLSLSVPALLSDIRIGCWCMSETNALAYCTAISITFVKMFFNAVTINQQYNHGFVNVCASIPHRYQPRALVAYRDKLTSLLHCSINYICKNLFNPIII